MNWPQKRIGDYLVESAIEASAPSADRRIRVRLNAEGIEKRPLIAETEGATRYFQRRTGQFIYGKQNLHKGAFGVVPPELDGFESSSDLPAFDVAEGLRPEWLVYFLKQGYFYKLLVSIAKGAATKRIQPEALFAVELPVPGKDVQDEIINRMNRYDLEHSRLEYEITNQQSLLAKLKQAILQEAIQGKLTADWRAAHPEVEPASQLLLRIQADKARLIADKKLRPEKPLPKITPAEIPVEIPKGWEWCRLDDFLNVRAGIAKGGKRYTGLTTPTPYLRVANVQRGYLNLEEIKYLDLPANEITKYALENGDLLVNEGGDPDKVGRCAVWRSEIEGCVHQNHIFAMRPYGDSSIEVEFMPLMLNSPFCQAHFLGSYKQTTNLASINKTVLRSTPIPLPPLAEQVAIVERVETLMTTCRALEAEIEQSRTHAADLLQAVLKEAFAPAFA